jgi:hypothetical protein
MAATSLCEVRMRLLFCALRITSILAARVLSTSVLTGIVLASLISSTNSSVVIVAGPVLRGGVQSGATWAEMHPVHTRTLEELGGHLETGEPATAPAAASLLGLLG